MTEETGRLVALDLETTGISEGNRVIEIGCVEIVDRKITGREFQQYVDPERDIEEEAQVVHGITSERLQGEPKFSEVLEDLLAFVQDAEVLIHNAGFDLRFLDYEMRHARCDQTFEKSCRKVTDTLQMARAKFPGGSSLDQLCDYFRVDRTHRDRHGALLDAQLLAKVYLHMTGGQIGLVLAGQARPVFQGLTRPESIHVPEPTAEERQAHEALMDELDRDLGEERKCLWRKVLETWSNR